MEIKCLVSFLTSHYFNTNAECSWVKLIMALMQKIYNLLKGVEVSFVDEIIAGMYDWLVQPIADDCYKFHLQEHLFECGEKRLWNVVANYYLTFLGSMLYPVDEEILMSCWQNSIDLMVFNNVPKHLVTNSSSCSIDYSRFRCICPFVFFIYKHCRSKTNKTPPVWFFPWLENQRNN